MERWIGSHAKVLLVHVFLLGSMFPIGATADIYKCTKGGDVAYQETPCEGANVQATHIEVRGLDQFVGCFVTTQGRISRSIEVRANGAGTYELVDEGNPLGSGVVLKQATSEELAAVSNGLHINISNGLSRHSGQTSAYTYTTRVGNRYVTRTATAAQPITAASLYGIYKGSDSSGRSIVLLHTGGGVPQVIDKTTCPSY
ncbi:hypothetical protein ISN76_06615 [Dyella halodurans]|uniref:DUF4124 domain-containing protein n=1 Tax=Dyella halodurans TaxID=1920171 RepID=A0ABV9C4F6_9GAMM|nr:hypothetical protein [Dyella halodurans]